MLVHEVVNTSAATDKHHRPKSTLTLCSSKSEQSIVSTPITSRRGSTTINHTTSNRLIIIISGKRYETLECTLSAYPETLLGNPAKRKEYYDPYSNTFYFCRDPICFDAILFYYQSRGILARPRDIPRDVFEKEVQFFGISATFDKRHQFEQNLQKERQLEPPMPRHYLRRTLWEWFEYPGSSLFASVLGIFSIAMILVSVIALCAETVPEFKRSITEISVNKTIGNSTRLVIHSVYDQDHWFIFEVVCIVWFTFEYTIRLLSAPNVFRFLFSGLGLVDLISISPFYITLIIRERATGRNLANTLGVIRILRLLRIIRVFKLTRYNEGLRVLLTTIYESSVHLKSILLVIIIMGIFFATVVFYAETFVPVKTKAVFSSIPDTFWYSIITMTTVGYGDVYPQTEGGRFLGAFCGIFGVLLFCLPSPVLVNKFIECYYLRQEILENESPERKKFVESMKEIYFKGSK
ncbi:potassium voltage-gated channel subfamily A member 1-like [Rhopilema esculentum]|uniref:potassium voltage-gated channel subfamily A member 1-like n=1 Tax=Rhopilema esculentum TaxID=499914 RepID=UPI0031D811B5